MYVLGTAGHVDHGKSTLIKALTGIDPDRLKEEKDRQMTIDLGFAWYQLPSGNEVGIVDVPGHRDFVENMLAGIGGIDAVLFIIAADEGVMPQTREHFSILKLLKIQRGVIILTKMDQVDDQDWISLVEDDIQSLTRNTFLESAPILKVSAISGQGLDDLASSIDAMLVDCPPKKDIGKARLPIDRVFTLKGFGTIVTGTLIDGQLSLGQQIEILPAKKQARIRGIQNHKKKVETAYPGNRTALNLVGLDANEILRGDVLANPGEYNPSTRIDAKIEMLANASGKIKHNDRLKCFLGSAESMARIRVLGKNEINPGDSGWVQMEFDDPIVPAKGDCFILRRPSPAETIAGGTILDPHPARRYKRFTEKTLSQLELMDSGSHEEIVISYLEAEPLIFYNEFIKKHEPYIEDVERLIDIQIKRIGALKSRDAIVVTLAYWNTLKMNIKRKFEEYYQKFPLRSGMPKKELNKSLKIDQKKFNLIIEELISQNILAEKDDEIALVGHEVIFLEEDKEKIANIILEFERSPYTPPSLKDLANEYDADLINAMVEKDILVKITEDIAFTPEIYRKVIAETKDFLEKEKEITLAQFRDRLKTSRKYALAFLEHLDAAGITLRKGDFRILK